MDTPECTCPGPCAAHPVMRDDAADELPPGKARRRDGQVVDVMATIGGPSRARRDPEGMTPDVPWRLWP